MASQSTLEEDFITRHDIMSMSDDDLDTMVKNIQARRILPAAQARRTKEDTSHVSEDKARAALEKKCDQIMSLLEQLEQKEGTLLKRIHEMRLLRMSAGLHPETNT